MMKHLFYICLLVTFNGLLFAQTSVGWGNDCDYDMEVNANALQQAIDDGAIELRLSNQNQYMMSVDVEAQTIIKGGYGNCMDALNDTQSNINSVINATGTGLHALSVKDIENANVLIDSISLINGEDSGLRLVKIDGVVTLNQVEITSSVGDGAGGLYAFNFQNLASPAQLLIVIKNSIINQNQSNQSGGGIFCQGGFGNVPISFQLSEGSLIHENHAELQGGGIYLSDCDLHYQAGINTAHNNGDEEIFDNTAKSSGGGLSIQDAEVTLVGDQSNAFNLSNNVSGDLFQDTASGGGLFAVGSSAVTLINAHVIGNKAQRYGAGLSTSTGSSIYMDVAEMGCQYHDYCSMIQSNQLLGALGGGAAIAATGGSIEVNRSLLQFNDSNGYGYVAHARNDAQVTLEGNLVLSNGIGSGFNPTNGIHAQDSATFSLFYNTTDGNLISQVLIELAQSSNLFLIGNIIDESNDILFAANSVSTHINCNMMTQINNINVPMTDTLVATATFMDQSNFGNYRLDASSINAMDVCADVIYLPGKDLSNGQRGLDNPDVVDFNGLNDLGAYEFNPNWDVIFVDSFE